MKIKPVNKQMALVSEQLSVERLRDLPVRASALLREIARYLDRNDSAAAEHSAAIALTLAPDHPECLRLFALVQQRRGSPRDAVVCLQRSLAARPDDVLSLSQLAAALGDLSEFEPAIDALQRVCELAPTASAWFDLGVMLDHDAMHEHALAAAEHALLLQPTLTSARFLRARSLQALGRIDETAGEYRQIIARGTSLAQAWFGLVDIKTVQLTEAELAELKALAALPALNVDERAIADFALGKALEDAGRHADAYASFERANAIKRRSERWNAEAFSRHIERIAAAFAQPIEVVGNAAGHEVIFIVGLPRSGSTLIEQVLAAHSQVEGASELPYLNAVLADESKRRGAAFPAWVAATTPTDWQRLGQDYLARADRWRKHRPRFTDKLPENWPYVGAVMVMLPNARIIDCRRDPLETCWSCYKQLFAPGRVGFSYAFDDLAAYWRDYEKLCGHWRELYPDKFRTQSYEALIANSESEIHALLKFCGLPFEEACTRPHEASRAIRTASASQVRQPIRANTAQTSRYGDALNPLRTILDRRTER
ncbi:MAG: sulfotransferase [Dokdonella sp.]